MAINHLTPGFKRYYIEYVIQQTIDRYSDQRVEDGKSPITATQGRRIRRECEQRLEQYARQFNLGPIPEPSAQDMSNPITRISQRDVGAMASSHKLYSMVDIDNVDANNQQIINSGVVCGVLNQTLTDLYGDAPRYDSMAQRGALYQEFMGYVSGADGMPRLPLSPYDERWAQRDGMLRGGARLMSLSLSDVNTLNYALNSELNSEQGLRYLSRTRSEDVQFYEANRRDGETRLRGSGYIVSFADRTGLSQLKRYMTDAEYADSIEAIKSGITDPESGVIDYGAIMSSDALDRSVALLEYLNDNAIEYSIERDEQPGQIRARLTGTRINVRLVDVNSQVAGKDGEIIRKKNEQYVGRVWDDGSPVTFSVDTGYENNGYDATPQEAVDLLRFVRGEKIMRYDKPDLAVGVPAQTPTDRGMTEDVFMTADGAVNYTIGTTIYDGRERSVRIRRGKSKSGFLAQFYDPDNPEGFDKARKDLENMVSSARENYEHELNVEELIDATIMYQQDLEAQQRGEIAEDVEVKLDFEFSSDPVIEAQQADYIRVLYGEDARLLPPGYSVAEWNKAQREGDTETIEKMSASFEDLSRYDAVRAHAALVVDDAVGSYEMDEEGKRFNPQTVCRYMTSDGGEWVNLSNMVVAMRRIGFDAHELKGDITYINRQLVNFDPETAKPLSEVEDPFIQRMGEVINDSLQRHNISDVDVRIDDNGVVEWRGQRKVGVYDQVKSDRYRYVTGHIGQILSRDELGRVTTKYPGGDEDNFVLVPGYEGSIMANKMGEDKPWYERVRLRGYEQKIKDAIEYTIGVDTANTRSLVGSPTSLHSVLSSLYADRYEIGFEEKASAIGLSAEEQKVKFDTASRRVHLSQEIADGASSTALRRSARKGIDPRNDNNRNILTLVDGKDMSTVTDGSGNVFSEVVTGKDANQGIVRQLKPGTIVDDDGYVTPSADGEEVSLVQGRSMSFSQFDPQDRKNMAHSNRYHAVATTGHKTTMAMMTINGWEKDDGIVISKDFAERCYVYDTEGEIRNLMHVDKLSDGHGNKGVIVKVIDRSLTEEEAREQGILGPWQVFKDNPTLDTVMAPSSAVSRHNGGSHRQLMAGDVQDLVLRDENGEKYTVPGGISTTELLISEHTADRKSHIYSEEDYRKGKGRQASGQLGWGLLAKRQYELMREMFSNNEHGTRLVREYAAAIGISIDKAGIPSLGVDETRGLIEFPDPHYTQKGTLNFKAMRKEFSQSLSREGGAMVIPFKLDFPSAGDLEIGSTPEHYDENGNKDGYLLPVLSSALRHESELSSGAIKSHDYTLGYTNIYEAAIRYSDAVERGDELKAKEAYSKAQSAYAKLSGHIVSSKVDDKDNMTKMSLMRTTLRNSATLVWGSDPNLAIDEIALSPHAAPQLDPDNRGYVQVWRDPIWSGANTSYMRIKIDPSLEYGCSVSPAVAPIFDGDFDGDSAAVWGGFGTLAHEEGLLKGSREAALLDVSVEPDENGLYPPRVDLSQNTTIAMDRDPQLKEDFDSWIKEANVVYREKEAFEQACERGENAQMSETEIAAVRQEFFDRERDLREEQDELIHRSFARPAGEVAVRWDSVDSHFASLRENYINQKTGNEHGAKGSDGKLKGYAEYFGAEFSDPNDCSSPMIDRGVCLATEADHLSAEVATSLKAGSTATCGKLAQDLARATSRRGEFESTCAVIRPLSQAMLSAKKDAIAAMYIESIVGGVGNDILRGHLLESRLVELKDLKDNPTGEFKLQWSVVKDAEGKPVQATAQQWADQMEKMICSKEGMGFNVGRRHIRNMAGAMSEGPVDDLSGAMIDFKSNKIPDYAKPEPLFDLAYGGKLKTLIQKAIDQEPIFGYGSGDKSYHYAPTSVRQALAERFPEANQDYLKTVHKTKNVALQFKDVSSEKILSLPSNVVMKSGSEYAALSAEERDALDAYGQALSRQRDLLVDEKDQVPQAPVEQQQQPVQQAQPQAPVQQQPQVQQPQQPTVPTITDRGYERVDSGAESARTTNIGNPWAKPTQPVQQQPVQQQPVQQQPVQQRQQPVAQQSSSRQGVDIGNPWAKPAQSQPQAQQSQPQAQRQAQQSQQQSVQQPQQAGAPSQPAPSVQSSVARQAFVQSQALSQNKPVDREADF